jgi:hypothetical protein
LADLSPAVTQALLRIAGGRKEHDLQLKRYDHAYDVYTAARPKVRNREPWQSDLRVKYGMQVIDTALVNIVSGQPRIMVKARHPDHQRAAKAMQSVMDYFVAEDHLVEKQPAFVLQSLVYGATAAKNHWLYREAMRPVREFAHDPLNPEAVMENVTEQNLVMADRPTFEPWDIYKCFWEPGARDVDQSAYVVLQSYLSKDDLLQQRFNPQTGTGIYHNVDELLASGSAPEPRQSAQLRNLGLQGERYKDKFLIEEIWTDDQLVVLGNGQVLLRQQPNPYWHGKKPIVIAQTRPDLFEMVGVSETELVDDLQQALQTVQNMRFDNLHMTVMRGITYREGGVTDPGALELRPRFKWAVSDHDDIRPFEVQPLPPEAYQEETTLLSHLQLVTGINPYVSGADLQSVDQNTATGVTALQEVASRLLRFKAAQIQYKGYQRSFEQWGANTQQFLSKSLAIEIAGQGNDTEWIEVGPQDVAGELAYHIEGSEESLSRQQERGEAIALLNAFAPLVANMPGLNMKPILERVALAYNFPNPEALVSAVQQQPPPAAAPDNGFNPQILGPRIGAVPQRPLQQGQIQGDPRLQNAMAVIGNGSTNG